MKAIGAGRRSREKLEITDSQHRTGQLENSFLALRFSLIGLPPGANQLKAL
jgi:hypothetical protein